MNIPKEYIDETYGIKPAPNTDSFNNIIFLAWYMIARKQNGDFDNVDFDSMLKHLELNDDGNGLYEPKNSHDNVTYKLVLDKVFSLDQKKNMDFFTAVKDVGLFRIWDIILYGHLFGPTLLKPLFSLLMFIPALQAIEATYNDGKVRPKWFGDGKISRYKWWFKRKKLVKEEFRNQITYKTWELKDGSQMTSRHMQNDGKHLAIFKLFAFRDKSLAFRIASKICRSMFIARYGEDYTYEILKNYFIDQNHPVPPLWKGHGDLLK